MAKQRRIVGDVVEIDLGDGTRCYARAMAEPCFAFYDLRTERPADVEEVVRRPVLFVVWVMNHAVTRWRWKRVGRVALEPALAVPPRMFIQDAIDPKQFRICENGGMRPATREECEGLECAAGWDPTHVEDRLRDHYAGRPNKWFEAMRIK